MKTPAPFPWRAVQDNFRNRAHRREAVGVWVENRKEDDLWLVEAADGSTSLVGCAASALLMAAAPDLLAALKGMLTNHSGRGAPARRIAARESARAAIQKAEIGPAGVRGELDS